MTGIFGTKIPASVCFAVGLLLFLLPFAELKCTPSNKEHNDLLVRGNFKMSFSNSGLGLALGNDWQFDLPALRSEFSNGANKWEKKAQKPNAYAVAALALGALGFVLSLMNGRISAIISIVAGILASAALLSLMIDLEKKSKELISRAQEAGDVLVLDTGAKPNFALVFTPWFYITVISFLVAAFFSFKRIQSTKQSIEL